MKFLRNSERWPLTRIKKKNTTRRITKKVRRGINHMPVFLDLCKTLFSPSWKASSIFIDLGIGESLVGDLKRFFSCLLFLCNNWLWDLVNKCDQLYHHLFSLYGIIFLLWSLIEISYISAFFYFHQNIHKCEINCYPKQLRFHTFTKLSRI